MRGRGVKKPVLLCFLILQVMLFKPVYAPPTPPFTQCPAVGVDTSCALLIVFNADGTVSILGDATQKPFDGIEDTLIGVQNNLAVGVSRAPISGSTSGNFIFAFDGDGICFGYVPHPPACPYGPTGYEGPGTSFTVVDNSHGVVNFAGGLAPGGSTYFSLEGLLTASSIRVSTFIALDPVSASNPVGSSHTVTATVVDSNGNLVASVTVTFSVISGPNTGKTGPGTTTSGGQATFAYMDTGGAGADKIVATFTDSSGVVRTSNIVTKTWIPPGITLSPGWANNPVGSSHTVTATVVDSNGNLVASVTVTFSVISGPNTGKTGTVATNVQGQATFTYIDTGGAGADKIVATFTDSSGVVRTSNIVTKTWSVGGIFWSPFGPATPDLIIHDYSDFGTMFTAFQNGQIDITDWPIQAQNLTALCSKTDIWCSAQDPELGIFQADINNHAPFLGTAMETARPSLTGSVANVVSGTSSACAFGNGRLTLNVLSIENDSQTFKDPVNQITITNQPSGTPASLPTNDQGGSTPTGTYVFPCTLAGTYMISGTMVTGNSTSGSHLGCGLAAGCTIAIPPGSGTLGSTVSATWNVVWNSPSTLTTTAAFPNIMKALAHLVDKPEFVQNDVNLKGAATCDDTFLSPANLIQGSPCVISPGPGSPFPAGILNAECNNLVIDFPPCNPISAYHFAVANTSASAVWWGVGSPGVASGYASLADIDAACQYLVKAGFTLSGATTAPAGTQPNTCAELARNSVGTTAPNATSYTHFTAPSGTHFVALLRTDPPRAHFGQIIADSINMLFGTPNNSGSCPSLCTQTSSGTATVLYYNGAALQPTTALNNIAAAVPIVFGDGGAGLADRWNLYTGGVSLGSTPDSLFSNYHSEFGSSNCGGSFNDFPSNYDFHCDPVFDAITRAGEFQAGSTPTLSSAAAIFQDAALRAFNFPIGIAMYSHIQQFAALNGWNWAKSGNGVSSSLVVREGHGTQLGFWSLLNARQLPGYTPASSVYTPGGGNPNLIRRGFSQDPDTLNPYQATTVWDFEIISQVFDSMLQVNPETAGANEQVIDWMTTSHSASFDPSELGCIAGPSVSATSCVRGITTQTWHLRNDLQFHDGTPVTAQDVVYSILTQRDDPSANGFPSVAFVTNAVALDSKTVQVKLESNSAYYELNIGGVPIIPQHLWGLVCGSISSVSTPAGPVNAVLNGPSSECADPGFDPLTCIGSAGLIGGCGTKFGDGSVQGIFTGSGPYVCNNIGPSTTQAFGRVGGSCIQSAAGALIGGRSMTIDSKVLLTAYTNYMRGLRGGQGNSLQKESWADFNNDGQVNILDASNAAFFFDSANNYWAHPQYACSPTATVVDVCVMSAVIVFFDTGNTAPFGGTNANPATQLNNLDPQIDPYSMQLSGTNTYLYYQTTNTAATKLVLVTGGTSAGATLPGGHTITDSAAVLNADGTLGTAQSGTVSVSGGAVTNSWSPALVHGTHYEIRIFDNGIQIGQFFATE